jgi:hypothetical protein
VTLVAFQIKRTTATGKPRRRRPFLRLGRRATWNSLDRLRWLHPSFRLGRRFLFGIHSIRRVETQSTRDVATGSIARRSHQATPSPKLWLSR